MAIERSLTDEEILRSIPDARAREKADRKAGLRATKAFYDPIDNLLVIETTRGVRVGIPRASIPSLKAVTLADLTSVTLSPSGDGLFWESLDIHLNVPGLLMAALGAGTIAKELARRGGQSTSAAKVEAARRNGARGGRPSLSKETSGTSKESVKASRSSSKKTPT